MTGETRRRGQPLSLRLALMLSVAVLAVLLITGVAVNRLVSRSLAQELTAAQNDRITLLAQELEGVDLAQPRVRRAVEIVFQRVVRPVGGRLQLVDASGDVLVSAGNLRTDAATERVEEPVPGDAGWLLVIDLPATDQPFLRIFNTTLLVAGVLAVGALVLVSTLLSDRLTRPLRGVAAAAQQLGAGDLGTRAEGGPDRESAELADAFNAMAERLQRSEELRRRAASDMAHDLATPATVLESQLQAMVDGVVPADREQLERSRSAASAMSGVIVQLRDLVDAEGAALQRSPERVPLEALLNEAIQALAPLYAGHGLEVVVEQPEEGSAVLADRTHAARALRNVLANAAQHSPAGGRVSVAAEPAGGDIVLRVTDQGTGIAADDAPHIFERFYRADPSRQRGDPTAPRSGSGIGLTIARELLRANGGDVWVERTGPAGTTFAIRLPAAGAAES